MNATPIIFAAGNVEMSKLFICRGANIDDEGCGGENVLVRAIYSRNVAAVRFWLACGVSTDQSPRNASYDSVVDMCVDGDQDIIALLYAAGAKQGRNKSHDFDPRNREVQIAIGEAKRALCRERLSLIRHQAADVCIALQSLELPAFVTLQVVDFACEPFANCATMHAKWQLITFIKHFKDPQCGCK